MKHVLLLSLILALAPGCVCYRDLGPKPVFDPKPISADNCPDCMPNEYKVKCNELRDTSVPLPDTTPYEDDASAKRYYLEWYEAGYRSGLTGYSLSCSLIECQYREARINGWYDGELKAHLSVVRVIEKINVEQEDALDKK